MLISYDLLLLLYPFAVLIDPDKRLEYDLTGIYEIDKYTLRVRIYVNLNGIIV